jgi:hypothetical protein
MPDTAMTLWHGPPNPLVTAPQALVEMVRFGLSSVSVSGGPGSSGGTSCWRVGVVSPKAARHTTMPEAASVIPTTPRTLINSRPKPAVSDFDAMSQRSRWGPHGEVHTRSLSDCVPGIQCLLKA